MKIYFFLIGCACILACNQPKSTTDSLPKTKQFALLMNLKNDSVAIAQYTLYHRHVWPNVEQKFKEAGIIEFKIYRFGHQTFLLITTSASFNLERDLAKISGPDVTKWDKRMSEFQILTGREKWMPAELIYEMK